MRPQRIDLVIDELVLEDLDDDSCDRLVAALEVELTRRLTRGERPRESRAGFVDERPAGQSPAELGVHVAGALVRGGDR